MTRRRGRCALTLFVFMVSVWLGAGPLSATDYYVDCTNGSDRNSGLAWDEAWETMEHAVQAAESTQADPAMINVGPGEYGDVYWDPYIGNLYYSLSLAPYTSIRGFGDPVWLNYSIDVDPTGAELAFRDLGIAGGLCPVGAMSSDATIEIKNCNFFDNGIWVEQDLANEDHPSSASTLVLNVTNCYFTCVRGRLINFQASGVRAEIEIRDTRFDRPDSTWCHCQCLCVTQSDSQGLGSSCQVKISDCVGAFWYGYGPGWGAFLSPTDFLSIAGDGAAQCDVTIYNCLVFKTDSETDRLVKAKLSGEARCTVNVQSCTSVLPIAIESDIQDEAQLTMVCSDSILISSSPAVVSGAPPAVSSHHTCTNWVMEGPGNMEANPLFAVGALGEHYLSCVDSGQAQTSPCVDAGSVLASESTVAALTTRSDHDPDTGMLDMGFHYGSKIGCYPSVQFSPLIPLASPGQDCALGVTLKCSDTLMLADVHLAVAYGDELFYYSDDRWTQSQLPWMRKAPVAGGLNRCFNVSVSIPNYAPTGTYTVYLGLIDHYSGELVSLASTPVQVVPELISCPAGR